MSLVLNSKYTSNKIKIGNDKELFFIVGPCVLESRDIALRHAEYIAQIREKFPEASFIFKSSFDKANRTSNDSFRGLGIDEGLSLLKEIGSTFQIPIISDVHSPDQITAASEVLDILQVPAFLCRQTDLLHACGSSALPVMIKKGQFLHPEDMRYAADKVKFAGSESVLLCERGSCFGYRTLVVDFRSLGIMRETGNPVVFDATHSVQSMGGAGGRSSGAREFVFPLARAAVSYGVDGIFMEVHENPDDAPSDGPNMLPITELESVLSTLLRIKEASAL